MTAVPNVVKEEGVEVPYQRLDPEVLRGLVTEFITREGTDYGDGEFSLDDKIRQVVRQLEVGKAVIVYDEVSKSCNIVPNPRRR